MKYTQKKLVRWAGQRVLELGQIVLAQTEVTGAGPWGLGPASRSEAARWERSAGHQTGMQTSWRHLESL